MDYYQSSRPPVDDSGLSGGVAFAFDGQIASFGVGVGGNQPFHDDSPNDGLGEDPIQTPIVYTLQICVDGVTMNLDVYAAGQPYMPE